MARKFLKKDGAVRNSVLTWLVFFSLMGASGAESLNNGSIGPQNNISLLRSQCGYVLDENISAKVVRSSSSMNGNVISFDFYIMMRVRSKPIHGKLSFSCFMAGSAASTPDIARKTTAADEIALEDSGGRYARDIAWQRAYEGKGWNGTIAYVNSIYGDQERQAISDFFLVCPNKNSFGCFWFEVIKDKLDRKESDRIPSLLGGIGIIDLPSTTPEASYKRQKP